jgi:hypothetical protein
MTHLPASRQGFQIRITQILEISGFFRNLKKGGKIDELHQEEYHYS